MPTPARGPRARPSCRSRTSPAALPAWARRAPQLKVSRSVPRRADRIRLKSALRSGLRPRWLGSPSAPKKARGTFASAHAGGRARARPARSRAAARLQGAGVTRDGGSEHESADRCKLATARTQKRRSRRPLLAALEARAARADADEGGASSRVRRSARSAPVAVAVRGPQPGELEPDAPVLRRPLDAPRRAPARPRRDRLLLLDERELQARRGGPRLDRCRRPGVLGGRRAGRRRRRPRGSRAAWRRS